MSWRRPTNRLVGPVSAGDTVNPTANTVLADTGALPGGRYEVRIGCSVTSAAHLVVQRRNAANDGNVGSVIPVRIHSTAEFTYIFEVAPNERIRVVMGTTLTGTAHAVLNAERFGE